MTTPSSIEERMARLEGAYDQINRRLGTLEEDLRALRAEMITRFEHMEARMDRLEARIDRLEARIDRLESRIDHLEERIDRLFYWILALLGGVGASILATILTRIL